MRHLRPLAFAASLPILLTACLSGSGSPTQGVPALGLPTCTGAAVCGRFDFGAVALGGRLEANLSVENRGEAAFRIEQIVAEAGLDPSFRFPEGQFVVEPGDKVEVPLAFEPTHDGGVIRGGIVLKLSNADPAEVRVELSGTADLAVEAPDSVSLGTVLLGRVARAEIVVENPTAIDQTFTTAVTGDFRVESPTGPVLVAAKGRVTLTVAFEPTKAGSQSGQLTLLGHGRPGAVVALQGTTLDRLLEVKPVVDFGFVAPGAMQTTRLSFKNLGISTIKFTNLHVTQPVGKGTVFAVEAPALEIPAGQSVDVTVTFAPALLGDHVGTLRYESDAEVAPDGAIALKGFAGGPKLSIEATKIDFDVVGTGTRLVRLVSIRNAGAAVAGLSDGRLKLASLDSGAWVTRWPEVVSTSADELAVASPPAGYSLDGIAPGSRVELRVTFSPKVVGAKSATLKLYTNDPAQAVAELPVEAEAAALPACSYELVPGRLATGVTDPTVARTVRISIVNTSRDAGSGCTLYDALPAAGASFGELSFPNGPIAGTLIPPGESREIPVRFSGSGSLLFFLSSASWPEYRFDIEPSTAACLRLVPSDWDFGDVAIGAAATHKVEVWNECLEAQHVLSFELQAGLSSEFSLGAAPAVPFTLNASESRSIDVVFRPTDEGREFGTLAVRTAEFVDPHVAKFAGTGVTRR